MVSNAVLCTTDTPPTPKKQYGVDSIIARKEKGKFHKNDVILLTVLSCCFPPSGKWVFSRMPWKCKCI